MKIIAWVAAALFAVGTVGSAPAEAQHRGDHWRDGRGWDEGRGYDRGRGRHFDRSRGWDRGGDAYRGRGWDRGRHRYGWNQGYRGGRSRVSCRTVRGYYGPVRQCVRIR